MKGKLLICPVLAFVIMIMNSCGCDQKKYSNLVNEAQKLYEKEDYLKAGQKYSEAFKVISIHPEYGDRKNAACAWTQANVPDSAFVQLVKIAHDSTFISYNNLMTIQDLIVLHSDKRWGEIIGMVKSNTLKAEGNLNMPLVAILDSVFFDDQNYREQFFKTQKKYGFGSKECKAIVKIIHKKDSDNIFKLNKILDEHGWPGPEVIGNQGTATLWMVIQHSDLKTQEKYLPMIREASKKGYINQDKLALLEDRVALRQEKKQIYGTQTGRDSLTGEKYVKPLEDPDNVDKRRAEIGIGKLEDYLSLQGIKWDIKEYKKKLLEIEAKDKN